ncbi:MAG: class I SAM-dependent methyltransferase [Sphingomonadales bacterium]|nr:class I SAM-dependent methyltransferase [Sphingomonadales bacterium]MBK6718686.1 class I SAM-dependent methyltransferase [Sphingomonadales bacterium]MBK8862175.1 class I SAM-dependent methyltransferase [Sphingomonadales bacterium]MBL0117351.1 class I SAM-dependent methyltransferase [Sphingomonadales bacterium]
MKRALLIAALFATPVLAKTAAPDWLAIAQRAESDIKLDEGRKPIETLTFLGIKKGDAALDFEAGGGYYTEIMARAVGPKGTVTAWLASQFAGDAKGKAKWAGILGRTPNAHVLEQPFEEFQAPANSYDFALFHLSYHDAYWSSTEYKVKEQDPDQLVRKIYAAMKPGGIVGIVDHVGPPGDTRAVVDMLHRIDPEVVKADFLRGGFKLVGESRHLRVATDDHTKLVFDPAVRGKTDRFAFRFMKPRK